MIEDGAPTRGNAAELARSALRCGLLWVLSPRLSVRVRKRESSETALICFRVFTQHTPIRASRSLLSLPELGLGIQKPRY